MNKYKVGDTVASIRVSGFVYGGFVNVGSLSCEHIINVVKTESALREYGSRKIVAGYKESIFHPMRMLLTEKI